LNETDFTPPRSDPRPAPRLLRIFALLVMIFSVALCGRFAINSTPVIQAAPVVAAQPLFAPATATPALALDRPALPSVMFLSMPDGLYQHLFVFHPAGLPGRFMRLTNSPWDDIDPAVSPDGGRVAYASRQNGYWDLYVLDLASGETTRVTDSPEYDGDPAWSPDGQWLVYTSYVNDNLEVFLRNLDAPGDAPIQLTEHPGADYSPAWSPGGREIAFVSDRSGSADIWLARLDRVDDRFLNVSAGTGGQEAHPAWSPDGSRLAWSSDQSGSPLLYLWDSQQPEKPARVAGSGSWPSWSRDGSSLLATVAEPNAWGMTAYDLASGNLVFPLVALNGKPEGMDWAGSETVDLLANRLASSAEPVRAELFEPKTSLPKIAPAGRDGIVPIEDVTAPYPYLNDAVDEGFVALRQAAGEVAGWDVLANLEQAFLPLTEPNGPGMNEEWLFTGRAFNLNPLPVQAGWMAAVREELGGQTYWRLYIKTRYQDGSQGQPLTQQPWNLDARYAGEPLAYEQGGAPEAIPGGYWVDLTDLALQFGWQRPAALRSWRTYYPAARFNQFYQPGGLDWPGAMARMYPPEALNPPTRIPTLTLTPTLTPTPRPCGSQTPQATASPAGTATRRPTWTPPAQTATP
jgi:TolB protein